MSSADQVTGVVLAGGAARRMGGANKALVSHAGKPLFTYAVGNLSPHCARVVVNAERDIEVFRTAGFEVVGDGDYAGLGPLAGLYAGLRAAHTPLVAFAPCDQLSLPVNVYAALCQAATDTRGAYACNDHTDVPTCAVLPRTLVDVVEARLIRRELALRPLMHEHARAVSFTAVHFANLNDAHEVDAG